MIAKQKAVREMHMQKTVEIGNVKFSNDLPFSLIAGPCQLESRDHAMMMAENIANITAKLGIGLVFKTSYDKANRTSIGSQRGLGLAKSLPMFTVAL